VKGNVRQRLGMAHTEYRAGLSKQQRREEHQKNVELENRVEGKRAAMTCLQDLVKRIEEHRSVARRRRERREAIERCEGELVELRMTAETTAAQMGRANMMASSTSPCCMTAPVGRL